MGKKKYDLDQLRTCEGFDVESALNNFDDPQAYFDALWNFAKKSTDYLKKHNLHKLINFAEPRKAFLTEIKEMRETFLMLGLMDAVSELVFLENAVFNKDISLLERALSDFHEKLAKITLRITFSDLTEGPSSEDPEPTADRSANLPDDPPNSLPNDLPGDPPAPIITNASQAHVILAVDDMPAILSSVVKMLQSHFTVMAVTSGKAALKVIEKHTPSLFLLDIEMPVMNGYELATEIRQIERFAETPIIFLTSKGTREDVFMAVRHGGNDYLIKPVDRALLLSKVQQYIQ